MKRRNLLALFHCLWLNAIAFFMVLFAYLDLELYFALGFVGLLVIVQLEGASPAKPAYILRMKYIMAVGVMVFGIMVARNVLEILAV
jgi:hypothetical protein